MDGRENARHGVGRFTAALVVFLLLGAGAAALLLHSPPGAEGYGVHQVQVIGPDGPIWNQSVQQHNGTALTALQQAAREGAFTLLVEHHAGFGSCSAYVRSIAGFEARGSTGWIYEVRRAGYQQWTWGDRSAQCYGLFDGDGVRWRWSSAPG